MVAADAGSSVDGRMRAGLGHDGHEFFYYVRNKRKQSMIGGLHVSDRVILVSIFSNQTQDRDDSILLTKC